MMVAGVKTQGISGGFKFWGFLKSRASVVLVLKIISYS